MLIEELVEYCTHQTRACDDERELFIWLLCELLKKAHDGAGNPVNVCEVYSQMAVRAVPLQTPFHVIVPPFGSLIFNCIFNLE